MRWRAGKIGWLGVLVGWLATGTGQLPAQPVRAEPEARMAVLAPAPVPVEEMPAAVRDKVRAVTEKPTLTSRGASEAFNCRPPVYYWLLDNPDQAVRLWRLIGAKCTDIDRETTGFCWHDDQGSKLHWDTVLRTATQHIWYAEGRVNPGKLLPSVDVQAVVVLTHNEGTDKTGKPTVRHQIEMYLRTDGKAIAMATKIIGASSPRVAEQYLGQMEMFFGALAWYLDQHPQKADEMFTELRKPQTPGKAH